MRIALALLALTAFPLFAQDVHEQRTHTKKAWEWTLDERFAARFDKESRLAPREDAVRHVVVLKGDEHPEVIFPIELFVALMDGIEGDDALRLSYRTTLRERIRAFGLDPEVFWVELEGSAADVVRLARARGRAHDGELTEIERRTPNLGCRFRARALANAREHFGEATFDRFLYTVVAPGLTIAHDPSNATPEHLRFLTAGCE